MATPQHDPHSAPHDAPGDSVPDTSRGYEYADLRLKGIIIFGVAMVAGTILIQLAVFGLMDALKSSDARSDPPTSPLLARGADGQLIRPEPPAPLLQPFSANHANLEKQDLELMHHNPLHPLEGTDYVLGTYGNSVSDPSQVRIPISRAMQLIAERGVPVAGPSTAPASTQPARPTASLNEGGPR